MSYDVRYRLTRIDLSAFDKRITRSVMSAIRSPVLKKPMIDDEEDCRSTVARTSRKILSFKYDAINCKFEIS